MPLLGLNSTRAVTTYSKQGEKETPLGEGWGSLPVLPRLIRTPSTAVLPLGAGVKPLGDTSSRLESPAGERSLLLLSAFGLESRGGRICSKGSEKLPSESE